MTLSMRGTRLTCLLGFVLLGGCATATPRPDLAVLKQQVIDTETAFAGTMAARDHAAFVRGKAAVAQDWKRFYEGPAAPFSWKPTEVEVLESGTLAISAGPVYDPDGKQFGVFNSIWRLEAPGQWRIVFDKGGCPCEQRK